MNIAEFAIRWLALVGLAVWLGGLIYLIVAAVILQNHAGASAGDLIGRCLSAMSRLAAMAMAPVAAWAAWALVRHGGPLAWTRAGVTAATVALALATGLWAIPTAARERRRRNEYDGPPPNPHAAVFRRLHTRAVRCESAVAVGLGALTVVEALSAMGIA